MSNRKDEILTKGHREPGKPGNAGVGASHITAAALTQAANLLLPLTAADITAINIVIPHKTPHLRAYIPEVDVRRSHSLDCLLQITITPTDLDLQDSA